MKRPLFTACLVAVLLTAAGLFLWPRQFFSYGDVAGKEVQLTGRVYAKEIKMGYDSPVLLIYVTPLKLTCNQQNISYDDNFICTLQSDSAEPAIGSVVTLRGILKEYDRATNPGQFDAKSYYAILGVSARIQKGEVLKQYGENAFLEGLWQIKKYLGKVLEEIFLPEDAAVLKTMLLGDKSLLDEETKTVYKEAGILHILAISGLHISLLGMGLYKLLRKLYLPVIPASVLCGGVMLLYGLTVGMPISAIRAVFMFLLRLLAGCVGRTYDMLTALMLCMACMLLEQPLYLYHSGFLLSFSAILAVGILKPVITPDCKIKYLQSLADSFFTTLSITVFTLPIQLYFYYEVSAYGIFLNLLVLPLVGWIVLMGVGAVGCFFVSGAIAGLAVWPVHMILHLYMLGASFVRRLPGSMWMPGKPKMWQIAVFCILLGMVILLKKLSLRYKLGLLCGAVLVFGIKDTENLTVTFLDVGQGDCICIELPGGETWLVDGGSTDVAKAGEYRIEPFLKSKGIDTLDAVFLSHADYDHTGGVTELLESGRIKIGLLVLPCTDKVLCTDKEEEGGFKEILSLAGQQNIPVLWLKKDMNWASGDVKALCLHPDYGCTYESENASSEVLYISYGTFSMLFTGDVEGAGEKALTESLREAEISDVTILKVAHHGSANSTSEELLAQIKPRLAIISCGRNNSYGHPHSETLERLYESGTAIYRTDELGAIKIRHTKETISVSGYR